MVAVLPAGSDSKPAEKFLARSGFLPLQNLDLLAVGG